MLKLHIAGHLVQGVVARAEIATVDMRAAERVPVAARGVEVRPQNLLLCRLRHGQQRHGRRLGERPAEALDLLVLNGRVHHDRRQLGRGRGKADRGKLRQTLAAVAGGSGDADGGAGFPG